MALPLLSIGGTEGYPPGPVPPEPSLDKLKALGRIAAAARR
jgi:hypothetical protein